MYPTTKFSVKTTIDDPQSLKKLFELEFEMRKNFGPGKSYKGVFSQLDWAAVDFKGDVPEVTLPPFVNVNLKFEESSESDDCFKMLDFLDHENCVHSEITASGLKEKASELLPPENKIDVIAELGGYEVSGAYGISFKPRFIKVQEYVQKPIGELFSKEDSRPLKKRKTAEVSE